MSSSSEELYAQIAEAKNIIFQLSEQKKKYEEKEKQLALTEVRPCALYKYVIANTVITGDATKKSSRSRDPEL